MGAGYHQIQSIGQVYRLIRPYAARDIRVAPEAMPHLGHRGVQLEMGDTHGTEQREQALAWWHETGCPGMLAIAGFVAALQFESVPPADEGRLFHLFLLSRDPADTELQRGLTAFREASPPPSEAYHQLFSGPFRSVRPFEYDFKF